MTCFALAHTFHVKMNSELPTQSISLYSKSFEPVNDLAISYDTLPVLLKMWNWAKCYKMPCLTEAQQNQDVGMIQASMSVRDVAQHF